MSRTGSLRGRCQSLGRTGTPPETRTTREEAEGDRLWVSVEIVIKESLRMVLDLSMEENIECITKDEFIRV